MIKWLLGKFKKNKIDHKTHNGTCLEPCCEASKAIFDVKQILDESIDIKKVVNNSLRDFQLRDLGMYAFQIPKK